MNADVEVDDDADNDENYYHISHLKDYILVESNQNIPVRINERNKHLLPLRAPPLADVRSVLSTSF